MVLPDFPLSGHYAVIRKLCKSGGDINIPVAKRNSPKDKNQKYSFGWWQWWFWQPIFLCLLLSFVLPNIFSRSSKGPKVDRQQRTALFKSPPINYPHPRRLLQSNLKATREKVATILLFQLLCGQCHQQRHLRHRVNPWFLRFDSILGPFQFTELLSIAPRRLCYWFTLPVLLLLALWWLTLQVFHLPQMLQRRGDGNRPLQNTIALIVGTEKKAHIMTINGQINTIRGELRDAIRDNNTRLVGFVYVSTAGEVLFIVNYYLIQSMSWTMIVRIDRISIVLPMAIVRGHENLLNIWVEN